MSASSRANASALLVLLAVATGCSKSASANTATSAAVVNGPGWPSNGATACGKYLTPAFLAQVLKNPAGSSEKLSAQACSFTSLDQAGINITLVTAGPAVFKSHQEYLSNPVPLGGVGDNAVRSLTGIEAVKGQDRMCTIDAIPPFAFRLSDEALAKKLGEICNTLFALP